MSFIKKPTEIDFGQTPIENIFINDFMPMANGTYVKVYLLGYKYATDMDESINVDNHTISKHLNIPLEDVLGAWDFWEKKGIIRKHPKEGSDNNDYIVEFLSLRQLYINNNYKPITTNQGEQQSSQSFSCSPEDLIQANKVPEIKEMFYNIDQIKRRQLTPNERMTVLEWLYTYNMDPDIIVKAFEYTIEKKNINNLRYVGAVLRSWYDNGIINMEKLEQHLEKTDKKFVYYNKVFKALGFGFRQPSKAEKETMDIWFDEWNYSLEMVLKACENSKKTSNPSINYINSILSAWNKMGITTLEELENHRENKNIKTNDKDKAQVKKKDKINKFQNFKQRFDKYSNEELERMLKIKK